MHFEGVPFSPDQVKVTNRHDFLSSDVYDYSWKVKADGQTLHEGKLDVPVIAPHASVVVTLPLPAIEGKPGTEYFLHLSACTKEASPLVPKGHLAASEQWQLPRRPLKESAKEIPNRPFKELAKVDETPDGYTVTASSSVLTFSRKTGEITSLKVKGKEYLQAGPRPNFWRPLTDNDVANGMLKRCGTWKQAGNELQLTDMSAETHGGTVTICASYTMPAQESACSVTYVVYPDGAVQTTLSFYAGR